MNEKVQAFYHVGAVALKGSILVFGGYHNSEMCMMKFDEEGALLGDLSDDGPPSSSKEVEFSVCRLVEPSFQEPWCMRRIGLTFESES